MAKSKVKATRQSLSQVRDKALGTKKINVLKARSIAEEVLTDKMPIGRNIKVLGKAGKIIKITAKQGMSDTYDEKATVKKSDLEVYDMLSKLAKGKGLKGKEAEAAINKVFKAVANPASTERKRTLTRAEGITKRQSNKRKNTNLLP